ncbi:glycosyltransferase, partial [Pseudoxanthomonas sp. SGD-10]
MNIIVILYNITFPGGTERAAVNLANMLASNHNVTIVSLNSKGGESSFFEVHPSIKVIHAEVKNLPISGYKKIGWLYGIVFKLKELVKNINPDIIIGEGHNINCALPFLRAGRAKAIACEHIVYKTIPFFSRLAMRVLYPFIDNLVVLSNSAYKQIRHLNKNTKIIPNALPFESNQQASLEEKIILMVGRLSKEKGYERLVPIAKEVQVKYPDWSIRIFGDGHIKSELEDLYKQNGLDNIMIHGPVKDIKEEYLKASIY